MKKLTLPLVMLSACANGTLGDNGSELLASWRLEADDSMALRDTSGRQSLSYPNPFLCDSLEVELTQDGVLRGRCTIGGEVSRVDSGGPLQGIPYHLRYELDSGALQASVIDMYGLQAHTVDGFAGMCADLAFMGQACQICVDDQGSANADDCQAVLDEIVDQFDGTMPDSGCLDVTIDGYDTCSVCFENDAVTQTDACEQIMNDIRASTVAAQLPLDGGCWTGTIDGQICEVCVDADNGVSTSDACDTLLEALKVSGQDLIPLVDSDENPSPTDPPMKSCP